MRETTRAGVAGSRMWDQQAPAFAAHHRVTNCDLRRFGCTEIPPAPFAFHDDLASLLVLDYLGALRARAGTVAIQQSSSW